MLNQLRKIAPTMMAIFVVAATGTSTCHCSGAHASGNIVAAHKVVSQQRQRELRQTKQPHFNTNKMQKIRIARPRPRNHPLYPPEIITTTPPLSPPIRPCNRPQYATGEDELKGRQTPDENGPRTVRHKPKKGAVIPSRLPGEALDTSKWHT